MTDTLLIDGTDIRSITGWRVVGAISHWGTGDRRGDDDSVPGRDGWIGAVLPRDRYIIRVPIRVYGSSQGERNDNLRNGLASVDGGSDGLCTLTRVIASGAGTDSHTSDGRFITGSALAALNPVTGMCELQYYNLRGAWWNGSLWLRH